MPSIAVLNRLKHSLLPINLPIILNLIIKGACLIVKYLDLSNFNLHFELRHILFSSKQDFYYLEAIIENNSYLNY